MACTGDDEVTQSLQLEVPPPTCKAIDLRGFYAQASDCLMVAWYGRGVSFHRSSLQTLPTTLILFSGQVDAVDCIRTYATS